MKKEVVEIVEVAEHFVKLSDGFISARANFPGAEVGQKWEVETNRFKIVSIQKATQQSGQQTGDTCWCGALIRSDNTCMNGHRQ